jgi:imidazolonepropionase-like amidohydrolase
MYGLLLPGKVKMNRKIVRHSRLLACLLIFMTGGAGVFAADRPAYALTNVRIFNGVDNAIMTGRSVLVRDGLIERITGPADAVPAGYEVIDCDGNYLLPGLFDVHTHLESLEQARRALESGVTTVRTAGVPAFQDVGLAALSKAGKIAGPDVVAAGVYVTPNLEDTILADPRLAVLADGVESDEALRLLVRINAERGATVIKTRGTERAGRADTDPREQVYTQHQLEVVVDEAGKHGLAVMVHAHGDEGARAAVLAGARSIEHGSYLSDETLGLMKERGTWLVPTYITMLEMLEEEYEGSLRVRGTYMVPRLEKVIRKAHELGVPIATGADSYYDAQTINRISLEAWHLVRLGLSPFEALQAATVKSAELLMLADRTGRIDAGFEADMILVPSNPLEDISALQDVLLVMSNGQVALKRIPFAKQ